MKKKYNSVEIELLPASQIDILTLSEEDLIGDDIFDDIEE